MTPSFPKSGASEKLSAIQSLLWRVLRDFVSVRMGLEWEEFNRVSPAGIVTTARHESYSARTGRLVKQLATFGESFTNNGLALSPGPSL